jgi:phenylalanyl-tRNA synthetase beta chain
MLELGQPIHTFDYDKIVGAKMVLRESHKGEKITTLDNKEFTLGGEDIVIEDRSGKLIDLAGIMGGKNSAIDEKTKNVLLFVQTYSPTHIRKTSMSLAQRTGAAILFEKGLDPETVSLGISRGIRLFKDLTSGIPSKTVLDIYPKPVKAHPISLNLDFICTKIGIPISKTEISNSLTALGFGVKWSDNQLGVLVPFYRTNDITIAEDIVEEVARIYGYHNLPSVIMDGQIPPQMPGTTFDFEYKIKNILKGYGGTEIYTSSLVPKEYVNEKALRLKNPLGSDTEYLRTSLMPSIIAAIKENSGEKDKFHLFEIANVYIPKANNLPNEEMTLAGAFSRYNYRHARGIIEALLEELNIRATFDAEDSQYFEPSHRLAIYSEKTKIGEFGVLESNNLIYYEFSIENLRTASKPLGSYIPIPKYPAQIEDLTLVLPQQTKIGEIIKTITSLDKTIRKITLGEIYNNAYTFQIVYQDSDKTLTNEEVEIVRNKIISAVKSKFGGNIN